MTVIPNSQIICVSTIDSPRKPLKNLVFLIRLQRVNLCYRITLRFDQSHIGVIKVADSRVFSNLLLQGRLIIVYKVIKTWIAPVVYISKSFEHPLLLGRVILSWPYIADCFRGIEGYFRLCRVSRKVLHVFRVHGSLPRIGVYTCGFGNLLIFIWTRIR